MARKALIVIDMINAYDHEDADALTRSVEAALPQIAELSRGRTTRTCRRST